ncbi:hypothetical protein Vretifemale_13730, partial [Volvox reticuliferus]
CSGDDSCCRNRLLPVRRPLPLAPLPPTQPLPPLPSSTLLATAVAAADPQVVISASNVKVSLKKEVARKPHGLMRPESGSEEFELPPRYRRGLHLRGLTTGGHEEETGFSGTAMGGLLAWLSAPEVGRLARYFDGLIEGQNAMSTSSFPSACQTSQHQNA